MDSSNSSNEKEDMFDEIVAQGCANANPALVKGKYEAVITGAYHELRGKMEYDMVHVDFEVKDGAFAGTKDHKEYHVTTQKAKDYLKNEFDRMGIKLHERGDISVGCGKAVGKRVDIKVDFLPNGSKAIYITGESKPKQSASFDPDALWNS